MSGMQVTAEDTRRDAGVVAAPTTGDKAAAGVSWPRSIVLVGPLPPPSGGMTNQTRQLARLLLLDEGCRVSVVQTNRPCPIDWVERVRFLRAVVRLPVYVATLVKAMRGADVAHVMANSGLAWHLFAAPAIWIASLLGVPAVVNYRGGEAAAFLARRAAIVRFTLRRAAALVVPSGFLREIFARHGMAAEIVPNVVDLSEFHPAPIVPSDLRIVVTRNLERIYDVATAIRALAIVKTHERDAAMTVAGSGPERATLEALARELGVADAVRFTGRLDHSKLPELYREASVALNPSRVDNTPNSLLEALASGVPIVSTDVGGVPHLVAHEKTALLVPHGNPAAMADAVLRLYHDHTLAKRLRSEGLAYVQQFAWRHVREGLLSAYRRAASGSSRSVTHA